MKSCDRCGISTTTMTCSYFNTQMICPKCDTLERNHPDFALAKKIENLHCLNGNLNFKGIGLPKELENELK